MYNKYIYLRSALIVILCIVHHTVILQLSKELHAKQSIQRHEEQKEERYIVDLLARAPGEGNMRERKGNTV